MLFGLGACFVDYGWKVSSWVLSFMHASAIVAHKKIYPVNKLFILDYCMSCSLLTFICYSFLFLYLGFISHPIFPYRNFHTILHTFLFVRGLHDFSTFLFLPLLWHTCSFQSPSWWLLSPQYRSSQMTMHHCSYAVPSYCHSPELPWITVAGNFPSFFFFFFVINFL